MVKNFVKVIKLAVIQLAVGPDKCKNVCDAISNIVKAKKAGADIVVLPEYFNSPVDGPSLMANAESLPCGQTCQAMCKVAARCITFLVGGTIPEICSDGSLSNTATVWNPSGQMIAIHRKAHLFDIELAGKMKIQESAFMNPGDKYTTFCYGDVRIGLAVGYDIRFHELSHLMARRGTSVLIYPTAFNTITGPKHMELLARTRAVDHQLWVVLANPAKSSHTDYITCGHSMVVNPDGQVVKKLGEKPEIMMVDIDVTMVKPIRCTTPLCCHRRICVYDTVEVGPDGYCAR